MNTKFSVVTITLNAANTIEQTIQSVLNQNYPNLEYIIIDGGSTDGTLDIINRFRKKIAYVVSEKDSGIADAFNKGVQKSTGEFIGILNSDDWYEGGVLLKIDEEIKKNPDVGIFAGRTRFIGKNNSYIFHADPNRLMSDTTVGHQAIFVKKSVHDRMGYYRTDKRYASDYDFFLRSYLAGVKFQALDFVVANMRDNGVSDKNWRKVYFEVMEVQKERLGKTLSPTLRYAVKILRTSISRTLTQIGFEPVVAFYRKHFSVLQKDREV